MPPGHTIRAARADTRSVLRAARRHPPSERARSRARRVALDPGARLARSALERVAHVARAVARREDLLERLLDRLDAERLEVARAGPPARARAARPAGSAPRAARRARAAAVGSSVVVRLQRVPPLASTLVPVRGVFSSTSTSQPSSAARAAAHRPAAPAPITISWARASDPASGAGFIPNRVRATRRRTPAGVDRGQQKVSLSVRNFSSTRCCEAWHCNASGHLPAQGISQSTCALCVTASSGGVCSSASRRSA